MDALEILNANWKAEDGSFLYYFHEENNFHEAAFLELCGCISSLSRLRPRDQAVSSQNIFSELFVPIVEINSSYGYNIKKLPIPQRRDFYDRTAHC